MTKIDHICYHTVTHFPYTSVLTLVPAEVVEEGLYKEVIPVLTERGEAEITHRDERTKKVLGGMLPYTNTADAGEQHAFQEPQTFP